MKSPTSNRVAAHLVQLSVVALVGLAACGESAGAGAAGEGGGSGSFHAQLVDNLGQRPIPNMRVKALDNATGAELGMETLSTDPEAEVTFEGLPGDRVAFVVLGNPGDSIDTYQYNLDSSATDERLWIVPKSVAALVPGLADYDPDSTRATVAGAVYWVNHEGEEEPVGCATVTIDDDDGFSEIRYFGDGNLPVINAPVLANPDAKYRTDSNPLNGRYFVGNAPLGSRTLRVQVGGQEAGSTTLVLFPGNIASDGESSVCISSIFVTGFDHNPTPAGCQ